MRFFRLSLFLIASVILLTSCVTTGHTFELNPENPVTLSLWHYYNGVQQTALDGLVKEFNTTAGLEKGILVEAFSYGNVNDLSAAVHASAAGEAGAEAMPDMFSSYADSAYELAELGKLAHLDDYLTEEERGEYIPAYLNEGTFLDGHIKIFPVAKAAEIFMLNDTNWQAFAEADGTVSHEDFATWDGLMAAAEKYYSYSGGKALFGIDYAANYFFAGAAALGQDIVIEDGDGYAVNLNEEALHELWNGLYVPIVKGHFAAYGRFRSDDVKTGKLLAYIGSTSSAAYFPTEITEAHGDRAIEAYVAPVPGFDGGHRIAVSQGAGICVAKSSRERELAAVEFLRWFTDREVNTRFSLAAAGYFPVKREAVTGKLMEDSIAELKAGGADGKVLAQVMTAGLLQFETYEPLALPVMEHSAALRNIFEAVDDEALAEREELLKNVEAGADYAEEIRTRTDGEAFGKWYGKLSEQVNNLYN